MNQLEIKHALTATHFSLLFKSKQAQKDWFQFIKKEEIFEHTLREIDEEAERLLRQPNKEITFSAFKLFAKNGTRLEYETIYFAKRRRLTTFALATLLYPENKAYIKELEEIIWSICDEFTWCLPAHLQNSPEMAIDEVFTMQVKSTRYTIDLFASETGFALSEILVLTKDSLDPLICKRIRYEIYQRIIWPYYNQTYEWEHATHNWAAVCAGSIGATALHLFKDDHELSIVLERVLETMEYYLKGFNGDGTCMEGYGYWEYGFGFYVYFSDLLKKRTAGKIDLFQSEKVHQIALFQQKTFLDKNRVVNFSDTESTTSIFLGLSHYLAKQYPDFKIPEPALRANYTADHCSRWAPALRNVIWLDHTASGKQWGEATYFLKESQWFISRYASKHGRYAFAAKGGHNNEPHNHNDMGHFILYGNEEIFLKDLGRGEYNAAYFGKERYSFYCNSSKGHSVPIINTHFQSESERAALIRNVSNGSDFESFELDITNGYTIETLQQLIRKFTWQKSDKPCLILEDNYTFSEDPESIIERFIAPVLSIKEDDQGIILGNELQIKYDRNQLDLQVNRIEFSNHYGVKEENMTLDFKLKKAKNKCNVTFVFQL
ncbi:heparinase II/III family protein [Paraliobacillus sediminis]|uniref:heparinase II/III family protein n=1 Tax=Paraliobacillus sediminis TaxID=1885916 RepID=UPI000E3EE13A|nr:heparinase II/III family protein [Paraliobacillus sediminis]